MIYNKKSIISDDTITAFVPNVRSFSKHIVSDDKVINNDIIGFSGTQTNTSDSTCIITMKINF